MAKVKIDPKKGIIEIEGSEEFVQKNLEVFKNIVSKSQKRFEEKTIDECKSRHRISGLSDRERVLKSIIQELGDKQKDAVPLEDIIIKAEESGIKKEDIADLIDKLKMKGELLESMNERFRVV